MAEQTFRSPGFFEREIDATQRTTEIIGVPAGVIGTAEKGPAFIPVTVGGTTDFVNKFGNVSADRFGPFAVEAFLANGTALTYMRTLGAGANETSADINTTTIYGTVKNAGFKLEPETSVWQGFDPDTGTYPSDAPTDGGVQFLCARHYVSGNTDYSDPRFIDNPSYGISGAGRVNLVRGVIFNASGSRMQVMDIGENWSNTIDDLASPLNKFGAGTNDSMTGLFALAVSSSRGEAYTSMCKGEAGVGIKIMTASLDPENDNYIAKVLNTDPLKFYDEQHLLYLDFPVAIEIAGLDESNADPAGSDGITHYPIALCSGSTATAKSGIQFGPLFGRYDTRYTNAESPKVISQPYGGTEYDLFHFEALSDGAYGNDKVKVSIVNLRASIDENYPYPQFEVQVRRFNDSDLAPEVLESYPQCTLDPTSDSFVAAKIGDYKAKYNFDADSDDEKRIVVTGRYANLSNFVRIVMNDKVYSGDIPRDACPFGYRGIPVLKTSNTMTDSTRTALQFDGITYGNIEIETSTRLTAQVGSNGAQGVTGSILPPLPMRFKLTRGTAQTGAGHLAGAPGAEEIVDARLKWGIKWTRPPETSSMTNANLNVNGSSVINPLIRNMTKFQGIAKMDQLLTGSGADVFNTNKFTLSRDVLAGTGSGGPGQLLKYMTGSAKEHILDAAYIRNGVPDSQTYMIMDPQVASYGRVTYATLIQSSSVKFNRFTAYTGFNIPLYGGFDGLNILDKDMYYMTDRAASTDSSADGLTGKASDEFDAGLIGLKNNPAGTGRQNNAIAAYRKAAEIMTDPMSTRINILAIPGIRDSFVTDHAAAKTRDYSMAMYVMDIPAYSESETRLFGSEDRAPIASASLAVPDVRETAEQFESRAFDNNYTAAYFPDVYITDRSQGNKVRVPASVAALSALGYNDKVAYPWFAPAGFNRGGLSIVSNTDVRLTSGDRDDLYDARVNPIANFSNGDFVIFGQKTCQLAKSALDRVNVRRMLLEVKRQVVAVADKILFEPNTPATRSRFIGQVTPLLATIQSQQGIESFKVIMDGTNNTTEDVENNRLNGRIVVVPTRAIEFIAIDFIITNSGVDFD